MLKSAILAVDNEGWKMPEEMEAYTDAFAAAHKAAQRLSSLVAIIEVVAASLKNRETIEAAAIPNDWPTANELVRAIQDVTILKQKVYALWKAIPADKQKMLTGPGKIGR